MTVIKSTVTTELVMSDNIMMDFKTVMVILRSILVQRKRDNGT